MVPNHAKNPYRTRFGIIVAVSLRLERLSTLVLVLILSMVLCTLVCFCEVINYHSKKKETVSGHTSKNSHILSIIYLASKFPLILIILVIANLMLPMDKTRPKISWFTFFVFDWLVNWRWFNTGFTIQSWNTPQKYGNIKGVLGFSLFSRRTNLSLCYHTIAQFFPNKGNELYHIPKYDTCISDNKTLMSLFKSGRPLFRDNRTISISILYWKF